MDTIIIVIGLAVQVVIVFIQGFFSMQVAKIQHNATRTQESIEKSEKSVSEVEKSIKEISEILPSAKLLYEHDENGNRIRGSIEQLIDAVNKGYPIKVRVNQPNNIVRLFDADLAAVDKGVVNAFNSSLISLKKDEKGVYDIQERPYHYFVVVSTEGTHNVRRVYFDGETGKPSHDKWPMAWFGFVPADHKE